MERYLITQSLLSAWAYVFDCFEGGEEDAMADFLATLNREKREPTDAMRNGIAFENAVYAAAKDAPAKVPPELSVWEPGIRQVAEIIKGAPVQVKAQKEITVDGMTFLVFGILDALKAGTIYDVKFVNKKFGGLELAGKYLGSAQHPAYFYIVPEAMEFKYIVSDGEDVYIETYRREDTKPIGEIISQFVASLRDMGLLDLYQEKWLAL